MRHLPLAAFHSDVQSVYFILSWFIWFSLLDMNTELRAVIYSYFSNLPHIRKVKTVKCIILAENGIYLLPAM